MVFGKIFTLNNIQNVPLRRQTATGQVKLPWTLHNGVWTHFYIKITFRTCLCGGTWRTFLSACTDTKHTQALNELQNAPLWVQRERPGSSQGIDHWHDLLRTTSFTWIRTCSMQQVWQIWFHAEAPPSFSRPRRSIAVAPLPLKLCITNFFGL